jgi:predicted permease
MFWRGRKEREQDLERELRSHLEFEAEEQEEQGLSPTDARYAAQRTFGNAAYVKEEVREMWGFTSVERLGQDVRYALRGLGANPGFSAAAVLTMALGIGANTAIFSVVNAALLRPLPYPEPERLVALSDTVQGMKNWPSTYLNYLDWKRQNSVFEGIAAYQGDSYNVGHGGAVDRVRAWNVSAEFFRTLKVKPTLGRDFEPDDDKPGAPPVLQITYGLWQRWFSANPAILGSALDIGGRSFTIIGVLPKSFRFYEDASLYAPLGLWAGQMQGCTSHSIRVIARLKSGVSLEQAQANMTAIAKALAELYPAANAGTGVDVAGLQQHVIQDTRPALLVLMAAVLFLLLIACVNVANLLLARGIAREREMAVRTALGAKWSRVLCQLLTESVALAIIAGSLAAPLCLESMACNCCFRKIAAKC